MKKWWNRLSGNQIACQLVLTGIFLLVLIIAQAWISPDFGDDLAYARVRQEQSLSEFLAERYDSWSSRLLIEAVMMLLINHSLIWRVLNIAVVLLLIWITADLFGIGNRLQAQFLFFVSVWMIPFASLCSAGWITTTTNYLWVLALGLLALRPIGHWLKGESCPEWEYLICPLCALYAANMEQMGAILLGSYLVFGGYLVYLKRRLSPFYFIQLGLTLVSMLFILSAPGNAVRSLAGTEVIFREFSDMSVGEKLWMGFLENAHYYIAGGYENCCCLFGCLSGVLMISFVGKIAGERQSTESRQLWPNVWKGIAVCLPLISYLCCTWFFPYLLWEVNIPRGRDLLWALSYNRQIPSQSPGQPSMIVIQTSFYLAVLCCVALTIRLLHGKSEESRLQLLVLGAGFASRLLMGFSPTIYASGDRTALFCSMAVLIVILRNMQLCLRENRGWEFRIAMGICLGGSVLYNVL